MTETMVIRCTGRQVDDNGTPHGAVCGRVFVRPRLFSDDGTGYDIIAADDAEYISRARSAGWAIGPDTAMCSRCRRPAATVLRDIAQIEASLR